MKRKIVLQLLIVVLFVLALSAGPAMDQTQVSTETSGSLTTEAARMNRMAGVLGDVKVTDKLSGEFSSFLGTDAGAVIRGLRNSTPITLVSAAPSSTPGALPVTTTTTINPPTGKMGFGEVFISLALARHELSQLGITQPTPARLQAALLGGAIASGTGTTATSTNLPGILTLRSQNMGWGQVAQRLGFKLGPVISGLKAANHGLAVGAVSPAGSGIVNAAGQPVGSSSEGVVSGSGKAVGRSGNGVSGRSAEDEGVVGGLGRPIASEGGITTGRGLGTSAGAAQGRGHGK